MIIQKDKYKNDSIKHLKNNYPDKIKNFEAVLPNYMGKNDLKILKKDCRDKWKYLIKKLAYQYEFFNCIDDYQEPVDNLEKGDFFNKLKKQMS